MHNLDFWVSQNYIIVEYLAQTTCAMSSLEVLQSFLVQKNAFLLVFGALKSNDSYLITFYPKNVKPRIPHFVSIQI